MPKKIKYAYCEVCKKEVEQASRKPLNRSQKTRWRISIVATLGIAVIVYLIYLANKTKAYCPDCFAKLKYSDEPFEKPKKKREAMTPKERVLDKVEEEKGPEEEPVKKEPPKKNRKKRNPLKRNLKRKRKKKRIIAHFVEKNWMRIIQHVQHVQLH